MNAPGKPIFAHIRRSTSRTSKHIPLIPLSALEEFRQNITRLIRATMANPDGLQEYKSSVTPLGLKKVPPYWYPYTTMAKMRWLGRELLEVVSTEFRDRSMEYYRYALESGVTTVNGKIAKPDTVIKDGDRIENVVHRHEPPVSSRPVKILYHDVEREFIVVDKPGSIPVHASGRYYKNTLIEILVGEFGFVKVYPVNRLDRLTSGLMIIPLSSDRARQLTTEFVAGTVQKEYVARCKGQLPAGDIICEEPLLTVDRQMGLNVVHPEGKPAKTIFNLIRYDAGTDSSIVRCRPLTGRSHQIRVHLQYLGYPIANDPVYSEERIWGKNIGRGGIDITPSEERTAPAPPEHLQHQVEGQGNPESISEDRDSTEGTSVPSVTKLLPRETGQDIGMGSPVPLSKEAVGVITRLRNMKDEDEDWSRWRDVVFRAKGALSPPNLTVKPPPPQNRRKRGGKGEFVAGGNSIAASREVSDAPMPDSAVSAPASASHASLVLSSEATPTSSEAMTPTSSEAMTPTSSEAMTPTSSEAMTPTSSEAMTPTSSEAMTPTPVDRPPQLSTEEVLERISQMEPLPDPNTIVQSEHSYCPECYLPLHPDPKPEKLYIFLHALKYATSLGSFETEMPEWAAEDYIWDRS